MIVPIQNLVENVDLTPKDSMLPLFECVINSIISLKQSSIPKNEREIQIKITRGDIPIQTSLDNIRTIDSITISDNGIGFTEKNYNSFQTPLSNINKDFGCKGIGRFTVLAAFESMRIRSNYLENGKWYYREFTCDATNEVIPIKHDESEEKKYKTNVEILHCFNPIIKDKTALSISSISSEIMQHCLIYYLSDDLPLIRIFDTEDNKGEVINELFERVSKEKEKIFNIGEFSFKAYFTKTIKEGNRKINYIYYCANSRVVGQPKNIGKINGLFSYPLNLNGQFFFLDVYVVSEYLNKYVYKARNGFSIPQERENKLFEYSDLISFEEIEEELIKIIEEHYELHVKDAQEKSINEISNYIIENANRYRSFLQKPEILKSIPPNLSDDKKEEFLYKISFNARKNVEKSLQDFIQNKQINEETIQRIKKDIQEKTAYDVDSLADYMTRRKAIIELFDKFLDADENGVYKLEEDIHNIIFPLGLTNNEVSYESHNLWLLDERFINYRFIASDKSITSFSQKKSRKESDLIMIDNPQMFDNPIGFGDKSSGEINSMVIFEFKRPGDVAHQKNKTDYRWEFSELVNKYFDEFLYKPDKKNYKGNPVILDKNTPKFGYVILDVIPKPLVEYNSGKGWEKTPFGTYFKINPKENLHIEVLTFRQLLEYAKSRHNPFFDKLFGK